MLIRRRWGWLDSLLLLLLVASCAFLLYRVTVVLEYHWNWQPIPQYLLRYDELDGWTPNLLLQGLLTTMRLSFWSLLLAIPLGLGVGLLRTSLALFNRLLGGTYVGLLRNLPPLVLIFICYFFISDQILPSLAIGDRVAELPFALRTLVAQLLAPPAQLEAFIAAVATLALFEAAYIAEIVRAGINGIDAGQWQAGAALGMNRRQQLRHIVLPQALQRMIPPLAGQAISTIKDSAIVSIISIQELTFQGMELMAATYLTFEVWITVTLLYFLLTFGCAQLAGLIERRLSRSV
jgi:polar amino acid transport system permease protein